MTFEVNPNVYESMYQSGYGHFYPESHIIRVHRHILEWELGIRSGTIFDFGCGTGGNLRYFAGNGFEPFGCDTSETAIQTCRRVLPGFAKNFFVTSPVPDFSAILGDRKFDIFLSNQVFYFMSDKVIRSIVSEFYSERMKPGGVFIASMMDPSCWYSRYNTEKVGEFTRVEIDTKRQQASLLVNFKSKSEAEALFSPFRKLHLGSYGDHIREDEGPTNHWLYVGIKD